MDLIDLAIIDYAKKNGIGSDSCKQISYTPFNPATKRTEAAFDQGGRQYRAVKGAAQVILEMCKGLDDETRSDVDRQISDFPGRVTALSQSRDQLMEIPMISDSPGSSHSQIRRGPTAER